MPLQNRVDPLGRIRVVAARGLLTGNRGVIHDPGTKTLLCRRWTTRAWICCALEHPRGLRREPMGRNAPSSGAGWTELFFLDEVTALAAGHRPCFYCRRQAAEAFRHCFAAGNGIGPLSAPDIDAILHRQRHAAGAALPALDHRAVRALPDGAVVQAGGRLLALRAGRAWRWSFSGYGGPESLPETALLVTPAATKNALAAGFSPLWHPTLP